MTDESLFAVALAIPNPSQRAAYLDRACHGDPSLRQEIEALLAAHAADNPLDRPPADLGRTGAYEPGPEDAPPATTGDRIGSYRLMEQIGEGGFGLVFVAEQTEPVRRKVALKVLKPGMDTRDVVARFEAERQALALMDHPNIARVFDAGSTPAGRPYFVMELVRGVAITEYCDQNKLPPRERLALFVQVCQAVQHAHQKGVIHRDLKPSNVLVTSHDGVPVPKVIDFGVAKAVGQRLTEKTIYTRFAQMIGTPLYMSPEQAEMSGLDVDTRADVYSLGVLLYELLTGSTPFDKARFRKAAFDEIRRIIREEEPPRPSTRLSSLGATLSAVSANRKTEPGKLAGLVRGELDWIVMRCLEKDRGRRYETANGLAKDVARYLAGDAVEACPPTLGYRLLKVLRKHRTAVGVAVGFAVLLVLGIALTAWQAVRATHAEGDAARQRDVALSSKDEAERSRNEAVNAREAAATERDRVAGVNEALNRLAREQRRTLYATSMNLAQVAWEAGDPSRTFALLAQQVPKAGEEDLRGFEWYYWERMAHLDLETVHLEGFGEDPSFGRAVRLSPDGSRAVAFVTDAAGAALKSWSTETGKVVWRVPVRSDPVVYSYLNFSADGTRLVSIRHVSMAKENRLTRCDELRVWNAGTGEPVFARDFPNHSYVLAPSLAADGSLVAFRQSRNAGDPLRTQAVVLRLPGGEEVFRHPPGMSDETVFGPVLDPHGQWVAAAVLENLNSQLSVLKVWNLNDARLLHQLTFPGLGNRNLFHSPDGKRLATWSRDGVHDHVLLLDPVAGDVRKLALPGFSDGSLSTILFHPIAFQPGGKVLAVRQGDRVHLLADSERAAEANPVLRSFQGHQSRVQDVTFNGNGSRLITLDEQGVVKHWDPAFQERSLKRPFSVHAARLLALPNADGSRSASEPGIWGPAGRIRFLDPLGQPRGDSSVPPGHGHYQAFSLDGRSHVLLWHSQAGPTSVFVSDAVTGKQIRELSAPPGLDVDLVAVSPDGSQIAGFLNRVDDGPRPPHLTLSIWETATGRVLLSRRILAAHSPLYSPDGRWIVASDMASSPDDRIVWMSARTGDEGAALKVRKGHRGRPDRIAFSRDGRRIATWATGGPAPVVVWEVAPILGGEHPEPVVTLTGHGREIVHVEFSPDNRRILTGGGGVLKLWDVATGREVLTLEGNGQPVSAGFFSPDGNIIWGGRDEKGALWGWDATPLNQGRTP